MEMHNFTDDWWPEIFRDVPKEEPLGADTVVVAEVCEPYGDKSYRRTLTALAKPELVNQFLCREGGISNDAQVSLQHPSVFGDPKNSFPSDKPDCWIEAGVKESIKLEPLVVTWEFGIHRVLWPDQGFIVIYGLVPRMAQEGGDDRIVYFDDPSHQRNGVLKILPVSEQRNFQHSEAKIEIARDYIEDYATVRGRSLIQVLCLRKKIDVTPEIQSLLGEKNSVKICLKGRTYWFHTCYGENGQITAELSYTRLLVHPGKAPISCEEWYFGELEWPGFERPIRSWKDLPATKHAYVRDMVLEKYQDDPEYRINPEIGSVSCDYWSSGNTWRVCRDLIAVELKKLYEGCRPEVIKHWHKHRVEPPKGTMSELTKNPNVAKRAKSITYALVGLGEILSDIYNRVCEDRRTSEDFVKLNRETLDYKGCWIAPYVEPITRIIPQGIKKGGFLDRCEDLNKLIVEGFNIPPLKALVKKLGVKQEDVEALNSLKLLQIIVRHVEISAEMGLKPFQDGDEIESIRKEKVGNERSQKMANLFLLYDLRKEEAHRERELEDCIKRLGFNKAALKSGYGAALDRFYDRLGETLEKIIALLHAV